MSRAVVWLLAVLLWPRFASAGAWTELCAKAGSQACASSSARMTQASAVSSRSCPADYRQKRIGDCWVGPQYDRSWVHPAGWLVSARCFSDSRFSPRQLRAALDTAARKFSSASAAQGGCLADYNPGWARELTDLPWTQTLFIDCPSFEPDSKFCGDQQRLSAPQTGSLIRILNVKPCMEEEGTGLAGVLFHETLHADGADSLTLEQHNQAYALPQYQFVTDRIYGTEALCFLGTDPARKKRVNLLQCLSAVRYNVDEPNRALCDGFSTVFYDTVPPGVSY